MTTSTDESGRAFVMPVWQVALVLNLTFAVGLGLGYAGWGRRGGAVDPGFEGAPAPGGRLQRRRGGGGAPAGGRAAARGGRGGGGGGLPPLRGGTRPGV